MFGFNDFQRCFWKLEHCYIRCPVSLTIEVLTDIHATAMQLTFLFESTALVEDFGDLEFSFSKISRVEAIFMAMPRLQPNTLRSVLPRPPIHPQIRCLRSGPNLPS